MLASLHSKSALPRDSIGAPAFAHALETYGARRAIVSRDGALSYAELAAAADAFARRLKPCVRLLLIEGRNDLEALIAYLGALRSGRVVLMHPPGQDVAESGIARTFTPDAHYTHTGGDWRLEQNGQSTPCHDVLALLLSTSGSTGAAKLVRLSAQAIEANALSIASYLGLSRDDKPITALPIYYSYGLSVINSHLAVGATILLTDESVVDDSFWDFASEFGGTSLAGVPRTFELLERGDLLSRAPQSLRVLTQAGGRLAPEKLAYPLRRMQERNGALFVMYGQTEATARIAYVPPSLLPDNLDCIGIAIPGGELSLRDDNGQAIAAAGKAGELIYRGPNIMMGYAQSPAELARGCDITELATGDIAERTASGLFRIVGRRSRFVKPFGLRIALDEIERALEADGVPALAAGTDELIAIAVKDCPLKGAWTPARRAELRLQLSERYRLPQSLFHIAAVADWPRLPSGKHDYAGLIAKAEKSLAKKRKSDKSASSHTVNTVFADIFPGMKIDDAASFTSLGGDSLNYVELASGLEAMLGELPGNWERLSIEQLTLLQSSAAPRPAKGWMARAGIDTDVALRAAAIVAIVFHHATEFDLLAGGVAALLLMVGYNWARFQSLALASGNAWRMLWRIGAQVLLPYFVVLAAFEIGRGGTPVSAWLLYANYDAALRGFLLPFWFVSAYVQAAVLVVGLSYASKSFRAAVANSPWRLGMIGIGAGLIAETALFQSGLSFPFRSLDQIFPLLALGWTLAFADTRRRQIWTWVAALAVIVSSAVGDDSLKSQDWSSALHYWMLQGLWVVLAMLGVLYAPRLSLPRWSVTAMTVLAAGAFTIYLTHTAVLWGIGRAIGDPSPGVIAGLAALCVGLGVHLLGVSKPVSALRSRALQRLPWIKTKG